MNVTFKVTRVVIITSSNQRLGSAFYRACGVIMENWVV